jgi:hypothetical protein
VLSFILAGANSNSDHSEFVFTKLNNQIQMLNEFSKVVVLTNDKTLSEGFEANNSVEFHIIPSQTSGALATAAFGLSKLTIGEPFLIVPSNASILNNGIKHFQEKMAEKKVKVGAIVFKSSDPILSYARLDKSGSISEIIEKQVSGSCALAGVYYFANRALFANCIEWAMVNNVSTLGNFYISPALNYFLANSIPITLHEIPYEDYLRY